MFTLPKRTLSYALVGQSAKGVMLVTNSVSKNPFFRVRNEDRQSDLGVDEILARSQASAERADGWMRAMTRPEPPVSGNRPNQPPPQSGKK